MQPPNKIELVTDRKGFDALPRAKWEQARTVDLVLDDGSLLWEVKEVGGKAFGMVVGPQTGAIAFFEVKELRGRSVQHAFEVSGVYVVPVLGEVLRRRRAKRVGARRECPVWVPKL